VVGEKEPRAEALDLARWSLSIDGLVDAPRTWSWERYLALPHRERVVDIHCVTGWTRLGARFEGIPLADLLTEVAVAPAARFVRFVSSSPRDHDTSLPLDLARSDTWLVHRFEGERLSIEHGFPLRTLTPSRYFYKSLKWLTRIELLAEDRLGFWERDSSYHNVGDPWPGDQRFTTGSLDPDELARFRDAESFAPWRTGRKVMLGLDLPGWSPRSRDLARLQLKNCNLEGARLSDCDLRGANLSLSSLRGADLRDADLSGSDLEGVDFAGTDLRGANLSGTALSATKFFDGEPARAPARVEGMRWEGASGLLEGQEEFLRRRS
jgi:hypothetical protein